MRLSIFAAAALMLAACGALGACSAKEGAKSVSQSNKLVILHTNDTHSQIDPGRDGLGGVMRRKAVIDSVRAAEKNVLLVDAGDAVQGTLYFYLYGGKVEQEVMNILKVDARILGNHEFDNGIDSLASVLKLSDATKIASNYNLENSALKGQFVPYQIKDYDGKKIALIGLNLDPEGMITKGNYDGLEFLPIVATANALAKELKEEQKVDAVIALSHIGYNPKGLVGDSILACNSRNIDIIIGGHSHDTINPATADGRRRSRLTNLDGKPVLVVQTGKAGRNIGKIEINLDSLGIGGSPRYDLIRIDSRYDDYKDPRLDSLLSRYSAGVDSLMHLWVGKTKRAMDGTELLNYFTDFILYRGRKLDDNIDFAIANKGGIRDGLPEGYFSKGHVINMLPFANYVNVVEIKGSDLKEIFDVMARTDGNGVSYNVRVTYKKDGDHAETDRIRINGHDLEPDSTYHVATIDYLAKGGDYMSAFTRGKLIAKSPYVLYDDLLNYLNSDIAKGRPIFSERYNRWTLEK